MLLGCEVVHSSELFWGHLSNERLLTVAEGAGFQALITLDDWVRYHERGKGQQISIICLRSPRRDARTVATLAGLVMLALPKLKPRTIAVVKHPDWKE